MKTKYKYIHFEKGDNDLWCVCNNKTHDLLGFIGYCKRWKSYTFEGEQSTNFDVARLADIIDFIKQLEK